MGVIAAAFAALSLAAAGPASAETATKTVASSTYTTTKPVTGDAYTWALEAWISAANKCINSGGRVQLDSLTYTDVGNGYVTATFLCQYN